MAIGVFFPISAKIISKTTTYSKESMFFPISGVFFAISVNYVNILYHNEFALKKYPARSAVSGLRFVVNFLEKERQPEEKTLIFAKENRGTL